MNDYLVWVDTSTKIASFHEVEASDLLHFEQYENFMNYLASLTAQGYCDVTRSVSKMTEIERRGGKRWDKPKKAGKSRDCRGGKF